MPRLSEQRRDELVKELNLHTLAAGEMPFMQRISFTLDAALFMSMKECGLSTGKITEITDVWRELLAAKRESETPRSVRGGRRKKARMT